MFKKILLTSLLVSSFVTVYALSPTLTLSPTGDGNNVTVSVTGDANTPVVLYNFSSINSVIQGTTLGNTDSNGTFSQTISTSLYGISSTVPVYVILNGYQSPSVNWPYGTATTTTTQATFSLSQNFSSILVGQTSNITITGSGSYYISSNTNTNIATAIINGSGLVITGVSTGSSTATVCQTSSQCSDVSVNVTTPAPPSVPVVISPIISVGQTLNFSISGNSSPYYLSSTNNGIFSASISGNILTIIGVAIGNASTNICASNGTCAILSVTVNASVVPAVVAVVPPTEQVLGASTANTDTGNYKFYNPLKLGSTGSEVVELQKRLKEEGYFSGSYVAKYGPATELAVKKYQKANGLSQLGNLGPATRATLNK